MAVCPDPTLSLAHGVSSFASDALARTTGEDGLVDVVKAQRRLLRGRPDTPPKARPVWQGSDPYAGREVELGGGGGPLLHEPVAEPALDPLQAVHQQPRLARSRKPV